MRRAHIENEILLPSARRRRLKQIQFSTLEIYADAIADAGQTAEA